MPLKENQQSDASLYAAAIARWDDEGGASESSPHKKDAGAAGHPFPRRMRNNNKEECHAT
jgi:hypothetical protein